MTQKSADSGTHSSTMQYDPSSSLSLNHSAAPVAGAETGSSGTTSSAPVSTVPCRGPGADMTLGIPSAMRPTMSRNSGRLAASPTTTTRYVAGPLAQSCRSLARAWRCSRTALQNSSGGACECVRRSRPRRLFMMPGCSIG